MKIIEGLKELKRIDRELRNIQNTISEEATVFSRTDGRSPEKQQKIVKLQDQSYTLLISYLDIKSKLVKTNVSTIVKYGEEGYKKDYSLSDLIHLRDFGIPRKVNVLNSFLSSRVKKTDEYKQLQEDLRDAASRFESHGQEVDRSEIKILQEKVREYKEVQYFNEVLLRTEIKEMEEETNKINDLLDSMNIKTDLTEN